MGSYGFALLRRGLLGGRGVILKRTSRPLLLNDLSEVPRCHLVGKEIVELSECESLGLGEEEEAHNEADNAEAAEDEANLA